MTPLVNTLCSIEERPSGLSRAAFSLLRPGGGKNSARPVNRKGTRAVL